MMLHALLSSFLSQEQIEYLFAQFSAFSRDFLEIKSRLERLEMMVSQLLETKNGNE